MDDIPFHKSICLNTVYTMIFAGVLFSRISRVHLRENFHFSLCAIYNNGHITKIAKLKPREVPDLVQTRGKLCTQNRSVNNEFYHFISH